MFIDRYIILFDNSNYNIQKFLWFNGFTIQFENEIEIDLINISFITKIWNYANEKSNENSNITLNFLSIYIEIITRARLFKIHDKKGQNPIIEIQDN